MIESPSIWSLTSPQGPWPASLQQLPRDCRKEATQRPQCQPWEITWLLQVPQGPTQRHSWKMNVAS